MKPSRLFWKLFAIYLAVILPLVGAVFFATVRQIEGRMTRDLERNLLASAQSMAALPVVVLQERIRGFGESLGVRATLMDAVGTVLVDTDREGLGMDNHLYRPEIQEARLRNVGQARRYSQSLGADMIYAAVSLRQDTKIAGYLRLARSLQDVRDAVGQFRKTILGALAAATLLSFFAALLASRTILRRIHDLADNARRMLRKHLPGRVPAASGDEIVQLAQSLNELIATQKRSVTEAETERQKLSGVFSAMREGVLVLDDRNRIERVNQAFLAMVGRPERGVLGRTPLELLHHADLQDALDAHARNADPVGLEILLGEAIVEVHITGAPEVRNDARRTIVAFHDVTRLKKLERVRADFVANVTHEIRTPLTAILGYLETLTMGAMEDQTTARRFLQVATDHAERLNRLVDDLLTLSRIELGDVPVALAAVSPRRLIQDVLPLVEAEARGQGVSFLSDLPPALPPIWVDRDKAVQALLNVLDNAVKFNIPGGRVTVTADPGKDGCLAVRIADTGIGIPPAEIPRLGERFYRVDKTRSRERGGTGLGLSIVRHLMRILGGRLEIASVPGKGTTVSLFFPLAGGKAAAHPAAGGGKDPPPVEADR